MCRGGHAGLEMTGGKRSAIIGDREVAEEAAMCESEKQNSDCVTAQTRHITQRERRFDKGREVVHYLLPTTWGI